MLIQTHSVEQKMAQNFFPRLLTPQLETPAETDTGEKWGKPCNKGSLFP